MNNHRTGVLFSEGIDKTDIKPEAILNIPLDGTHLNVGIVLGNGLKLILHGIIMAHCSHQLEKRRYTYGFPNTDQPVFMVFIKIYGSLNCIVYRK